MASNPIYAICWLILLWFLAWPVAMFCAGLWVLFQVSYNMRWKVDRDMISSSILFNRILTHNPYLSNNIFISIYSPSKLALTVAVILTSRWKTLSLGPKMLGKPFQSAAHHAQHHKFFFRVNYWIEIGRLLSFHTKSAIQEKQRWLSREWNIIWRSWKGGGVGGGGGSRWNSDIYF